MRKIAIIEKIHQDGIDLLKENPNFDFEIIEDSSEENLIKVLPKFVIEDMKTVNGKIVGEKHIKSILLGKDGSSVKSIAFNAVENDFGGYLLNKNNKTFNIAGKLSLNEWRGQSNVEFIIDDISVNKTFKNKVPSSIG